MNRTGPGSCPSLVDQVGPLRSPCAIAAMPDDRRRTFGEAVGEELAGRRSRCRNPLRSLSTHPRPQHRKQRMLSALSEGLRNGQIGLRLAEEALELNVASRIDLELKARQKNGESTLSIRLHWKTGSRRGSQSLLVYPGAIEDSPATPSTKAKPRASASKAKSSGTKKTSKTAAASRGKASAAERTQTTGKSAGTKRTTKQ